MEILESRGVRGEKVKQILDFEDAGLVQRQRPQPREMDLAQTGTVKSERAFPRRRREC